MLADEDRVLIKVLSVEKKDMVQKNNNELIYVIWGILQERVNAAGSVTSTI